MSNQQQAPRKLELTTPAEREIVTARVFDAPRERVFSVFTDPELIPQWWGETTVVDKMDFTPGGDWRYVHTGPGGEVNAFRGTYREIVPPERIVNSFEWEGMPGHVLIETVIFEDLGERTKVTNTSLFHTPEERDGMLSTGMEQGMNECYERIDGLLAEGAGG